MAILDPDLSLWASDTVAAWRERERVLGDMRKLVSELSAREPPMDLDEQLSWMEHGCPVIASGAVSYLEEAAKHYAEEDAGLAERIEALAFALAALVYNEASGPFGQLIEGQ